MKSSRIGSVLLACSFLAMLALVFLGCELQNTDSVVRTVGTGVSGTYLRDGGSNVVVSTNSGKAIFRFDLRQTGDQLEAVDNNGNVYRGTIGRESDTLLTFTMQGENSAGTPVTMSGTIEISGSSGETSQGTMRGTWIEPKLYATIYGVASVPSGGGGSSGGSVQISPTSATITNNSGTKVFSATGGSGTYSWSLSAESLGDLSATVGASVTYTRVASGANTITVKDGNNPANAASVTIQQP